MTKRLANKTELAILVKLLSESFKDSDKLRLQLKDIQVSSTDDEDNYGSIYLFPVVKERAEVPLRVPVEGLVNDSDRSPVNILLHVVDGLVHELEIVKLDGSALKTKINPEAIKVIVNH